MKKLLASTLVAGALLLGAAPGSVEAGGQGRFPIAGLVPHIGAKTTFPPHALAAAGYGPLSYHGGDTMRTNTTFAIYWVPSGYHVSAQYESLINGYLASVAAASGTTSNVYSVATQYYDTTGPIAYSSTFGGSYVDTSPFPASGCHDGSDPVCLTDAQLETEIENTISARSWPTGQTSLFFIMTPDNVGICTDGSGAYCTTNTFCAYHSAFNGASGFATYAVEPYDATIGGGAYCTGGNSPNNDDADATINTISHEHLEAITDPTGYAWYSGSGDEIADLCAWHFGSALGGTSGHQYNQVINGHDYWLQTEYSNDGGACLQHYTLPIPPPTIVSLPVVSGVAAVGEVLTTTTGSWANSPTAYTYQWQECAADGTGCTDIPGGYGPSYQLDASEVGHTVRSEIVASNGGGPSIPSVSVPTSVVVPVPASTAPPTVSGATVVGKKLSATPGTWNTAATFAYEWLRCARKGSKCRAIAGATHSTYKLFSADMGHTIKAQVSATNVAGTIAALSTHTSVVIGVPKVAKKPRITGDPTINRKLTARKGVWRGPPKRYRYEWLRCNAQGGSCTQIKGARYVRYRLTASDVGHTLRVRVIALNAAGKTETLSRPSGVVHY
jgi:hypothetical protein